MHIRNIWSKRNWFVVTSVFTKFVLGDTNISFVLSVTSEPQKGCVAQRGDLDGEFIATKCRIGPQMMLVVAPAQTGSQLSCT